MADLLLVDNDVRIAELLRFFLAKRGHVVRVANSFRAARTEIGAQAPDLMLSDLDLGAERGDEELPRLAREGALPPTLVVSGFLDARTEESLARLPQIVGTLRKPFDLQKLEAMVQEALARAPAVTAPRAHSSGNSSSGALTDDGDGWVDLAPAEGAP